MGHAAFLSSGIPNRGRCGIPGGARRALAAMDHAVRQAQRATGRPPITVATRPGTGSGLLADVLRIYGALAAASPTEIVFTAAQPGALREGTADVAVICDSDKGDDLEIAQLASERPMALLPTGHPVAERGAVTLAELRAHPDYLPQCPTEPLDVVMDRVALGRLVVVVGESAADRLGRSVTAVPVADLPPTDLVLAWSPHARHPDLARFLHTARAIAARQPGQGQAS